MLNSGKSALVATLLVAVIATAQEVEEPTFSGGALQLTSAPNPLPLDPKFKLTANAWTYDEALAALRRHPDNAYLQYVVLQLARTSGKIEHLRTEGFFAARQQERHVDLFSLFTGAHAVQESLQLDTMLPPTEAPEAAALPVAAADPANPPAVRVVQQANRREVPATIVEEFVQNGVVVKEKRTILRTVIETTTKEVVVTQAQAAMIDLAKDSQWLTCSAVAPVAPFPGSVVWCTGELPPPLLSTVATPAKLAGATTAMAAKRVALADISGPSTRSHPWTKLLAGRNPALRHEQCDSKIHGPAKQLGIAC